MLKLFISKAVKLDEKEMVVLAALNGLYSIRQEYLLTSVDILGCFISGRFLKTTTQRDRTILQNIRLGVQSLADRGLIEMVNQDNDNYIISSKGLEVDTEKEHFVIVESWEMQKIFTESNKPFNVFMFFVYLMGTINIQTKEWHMSQDDMAVSWGASKRTINDYLGQLENMQLIYVYRHKKRRADGTYHKINNSYGRYADRDYIIAEAQGYVSMVESEDIYDKLDRRAIKLRYNAFRDGAKKYKDNPTGVYDLYNECLKYNKSLEFKPISGTYDGDWKQGELLDLSLFPDEVKDINSQWGEADPLEFEIENIS
ncbi:hypothetical protein FYJ38_24270 [Clostridium sp. WB02_MRS01]|uniref:hypothetical protein n=1 Tax=Clostridium sp. WB02_MRS01 TaxID=2605777 RepID=UPI0012B2A501|nr:hypothetical protein [Clostridium sp. WB02_MRS01]MSS11725.1 hypothetical protein [Clostridium sp. WB02_MRS01]